MAKKKAKKVVQKKVEKKPMIKNPFQKPAFKKVSPEVSFVLCTGTPIYSLIELVDAFDNMANEVFEYHVNESKNDFANWIKDVVKETDLAEKLLKAHNKDAHQLIILKHLLSEIKKDL